MHPLGKAMSALEEPMEEEPAAATGGDAPAAGRSRNVRLQGFETRSSHSHNILCSYGKLMKTSH